MKKTLLALLFIGMSFTSCDSDDDTSTSELIGTWQQATNSTFELTDCEKQSTIEISENTILFKDYKENFQPVGLDINDLSLNLAITEDIVEEIPDCILSFISTSTYTVNEDRITVTLQSEINTGEQLPSIMMKKAMIDHDDEDYFDEEPFEKENDEEPLEITIARYTVEGDILTFIIGGDEDEDEDEFGEVIITYTRIN